MQFLGHKQIMNWMVKKLLEVFMKKNLQKPRQERFTIEKGLKRKGDQLNIKCKGYNNRFKSWIDKKDLEWNFINEIFGIKFFKSSFLNEILYMKLFLNETC